MLSDPIPEVPRPLQEAHSLPTAKDGESPRSIRESTNSPDRMEPSKRFESQSRRISICAALVRAWSCVCVYIDTCIDKYIANFNCTDIICASLCLHGFAGSYLCCEWVLQFVLWKEDKDGGVQERRMVNLQQRKRISRTRRARVQKEPEIAHTPKKKRHLYLNEKESKAET